MGLRVAFLEKKESIHSGCFQKSFIENAEKWIVFGHFDTMHIYKPTEKDLLSAIRDNNKLIIGNQENKSYYSALYMISEEDDGFFWDDVSPFLAVIRVHFSSHTNFSDTIKNLSNSMKKISSNKYIYNIYNTLELSDAIIVVKSETLSEILNVAYEIKKFDFVGEIYTYASVRMEYISRPELIKEDEIDLVSLRFSVSKSKNVKYISDLAESIFGADCYLTNGLDDMLLISDKVHVNKILHFYHELFFTGKKTDANATSSITRIGLSFKKLNDANPIIGKPSEKSKLEKICERLFETNNEIQEIINLKQEKGLLLELPWNETLCEIVKLLLRMSKTPVLDEFVYLILPAMNAFLMDLQLYLNNLEQLSNHDIQMQEKCIYEFIQSMADLSEQVTRTEGQLSHNPELRPILYDIPIAVLEYTLATVNTCSQILSIEDVNEKINFLLVPQICERVEAVEIFRADETTVGLLKINIPVELLYDPKKLISNLIHEISHFIGERHRYREERIENYANASSILFNKLIFNTYNKMSISTVAKELSDNCNSNCLQKNKIRISDMELSIYEWCENIIDPENVSEFSKLIRRIINDGKNGFKVSLDRYEYMTNYQVYFQPLIKNITMLFREVYADINMLYFLPISDEDYVAWLYEDIKDEPFGTDIYWLYILRIYICLRTIGRNLILVSKNKGVNKNVSKGIVIIEEDFNLDKEKHQTYYPIGVVLQVLEYAQRCYSSIEACFNDEEKYSDKKQNMIDFYKNFKYKDFLDSIDTYRNNILDEFD